MSLPTLTRDERLTWRIPDEHRAHFDALEAEPGHKEFGPDYYDIDGTPLSMADWTELFESRKDGDWWRVGHDEIGAWRVSTVWLGLNHAFHPDAAPLFFETMAFGPEGSGEEQWRYSSWEAAEHGHARMVELIRARQLLYGWDAITYIARRIVGR